MGAGLRYEVEQKFAVSDTAALLERLARLGVELGPPIEQRDQYFNHPARDFAVTDEALRLRQSGPWSFLTYKGPKIDAATKTRREIEVPLPDGAAQGAEWPELLQALGFRSVADVRKRRRCGRLSRGEWELEIVLDEVEQVGTYCELELQADDGQLDAARQCLAETAAELQLNAVERRSYLELLLARQ